MKALFSRFIPGVLVGALLVMSGAVLAVSVDTATDGRLVAILDSLLTDTTNIHTTLTAALVDRGANKTQIDAIVTDHADYITKMTANVVDLTATRTDLVQRQLLDNTSLAWATIADATSDKMAKSTSNITYRIDGQNYYKAATDDLWDCTGIATPTAFAAVALYLDASGTATVETVGTGASEAAAILAMTGFDADKSIIGVYTSTSAENFAAAAALAGNYYEGIPQAYWTQEVTPAALTVTNPAAATGVAAAAATATSAAAATASMTALGTTS